MGPEVDLRSWAQRQVGKDLGVYMFYKKCVTKVLGMVLAMHVDGRPCPRRGCWALVTVTSYDSGSGSWAQWPCHSITEVGVDREINKTLPWVWRRPVTLFILGVNDPVVKCEKVQV